MLDKSILLPFFEWIGTTSIGISIAESTYAFAIIEVVHLFGIVLLLGGASVMSLRLARLIWRDRPVSTIADELGWYTFAGLVAMMISGLLMFSSNPMKYYESGPFWWKMLFYWAGVVFHFTMYRRATRSDNTGMLMGGVTAVLAVFLWYTTGAFGRAIGFF